MEMLSTSSSLGLTGSSLKQAQPSRPQPNNLINDGGILTASGILSNNKNCQQPSLTGQQFTQQNRVQNDTQHLQQLQQLQQQGCLNHLIAPFGLAAAQHFTNGINYNGTSANSMMIFPSTQKYSSGMFMSAYEGANLFSNGENTPQKSTTSLQKTTSATSCPSTTGANSTTMQQRQTRLVNLNGNLADQQQQNPSAVATKNSTANAAVSNSSSMSTNAGNGRRSPKDMKFSDPSGIIIKNEFNTSYFSPSSTLRLPASTTNAVSSTCHSSSSSSNGTVSTQPGAVY